MQIRHNTVKRQPLLIEPFGIEIEERIKNKLKKFILLIEPFGIEIKMLSRLLVCLKCF